MKRAPFQRLSPRTGRMSVWAALAAGCLLAACSRENDPAGQPLAAGEYPVTLTAAVVPATRATADNAWTGGEQVAVEAAAADQAAVVKTYTAAADQTLSATDPFYWQRTDETKTLRAWYCGDGSTAAGGSNAATVPAEWSIAADQSGTTAGSADDGFQQSDLLFAPATAATFAGAAAVPLRFYHQTAKVVVNIKNAASVTDAAQILAVAIGDGDLALTGSFTAPADGTTAGTWNAAAADGTITPRKLDAPSDATKHVASYAALVIPQPTAGRRMVAVTTDAGTLYYTAPDDATPLAAGKVRTYNITVLADRLEVETVGGGTWTDGGSEEVESKEVLASYTANDLKIGDYFYSDGTTSDGGLRKRYSDGSIGMAAEKPAPETGEGKTVVGIVFQTDPDRIGQAEKEALAAKGVSAPHGLVMAVKTAATGIEWGLSYSYDEGLTKCVTKAQCYNDISGLGNYAYIRDNHAGFSIERFPAFKAADDYNTICPVTGATTGWYLPACGQCWDLVQNLGGSPALADQGQQTSSDTGGTDPISSGDLEWKKQGDTPSALNAWMTEIADGNKVTFYSGSYFWSSSEHTSRKVRSWRLIYAADYNNELVYCFSESKTNRGIDVWPVLAF